MEPNDDRIIQKPLTKDHPSSTKHIKGGRIIYCNLARPPYDWCVECTEREICDEKRGDPVLV